MTLSPGTQKRLGLLADRARLARKDADAVTQALHKAIAKAHPDLSYSQIAALTKLSYGRIRQIVAEVRAEEKEA